jgi:hypothetical protein
MASIHLDIFHKLPILRIVPESEAETRKMLKIIEKSQTDSVVGRIEYLNGIGSMFIRLEAK